MGASTSVNGLQGRNCEDCDVRRFDFGSVHVRVRWVRGSRSAKGTQHTNQLKQVAHMKDGAGTARGWHGLDARGVRYTLDGSI